MFDQGPSQAPSVDGSATTTAASGGAVDSGDDGIATRQTQFSASGAIPPVAPSGGAVGPTASEMAFDAPTGGGLGASGAGAAGGGDDKARMQQLFQSRETNLHSYHGSTSELLGPLAGSDATLLSSDEVRRRNGDPVAAQSTLFTGGVSDSISVARGESGLATATAYAEAKSSMHLYDARLYSTPELERMVALYDQHTRTVVDISASDKVRKDTPNVQGLHIEVLKAELERRHHLKPGEAIAPTTYPIVFELDTKELKFHDGGPVRFIEESIDLHKRLVRVYVPAAHVAEATVQVQQLIGHPVEVLSMEAAQGISENFDDEIGGARTQLHDRQETGDKQFEDSVTEHPGGLDTSPSTNYLREKFTMGSGERRVFSQLGEGDREAWYKLKPFGKARGFLTPAKVGWLARKPEPKLAELAALDAGTLQALFSSFNEADPTYDAIWSSLVDAGLGTRPFSYSASKLTVEGRVLDVAALVAKHGWGPADYQFVLTGQQYKSPYPAEDATEAIVDQPMPSSSVDGGTLSHTHQDPDHMREFFAQEHTPGEIVGEVGQVHTPWGGTMKDEYAQDAGVNEGYKLGQHHRMVLGTYQRHFAGVDGATPGMDRGLFELTLALHDSGKAAARRAGDQSLQHQYTDQIIDGAGGELPVEPMAKTRMKAVISGDPLGAMFKGAHKPQETAATIRQMAKPTGMSAKDFLRLITTYYQCDAASYTVEAGGKQSLESVFVVGADGTSLEMDQSKGRLKFNSQNEALYGELEAEIAKDVDVPQPTG